MSTGTHAQIVTVRPTDRWQFTILDMLAYAVVVAAGMAVIAGFAPERWFSDAHFTALWSLLIIGVSGAGAAWGVWIETQSCERLNTRPLFTFAGALLAWLLTGTVWMVYPYILLLLALLVPAYLAALVAWTWADTRARRDGKESPAFWPFVLRAGLMTAALLVLVAFCIPNMVRSRLAANESAAIAACKTYAGAQDIYRRTDYDNDGVLEYATSIAGDFSLYERSAGSGDVALLDQAFARASRLNDSGIATPRAGYYFKVLTGQGPNGPGGRKCYLVNGNMTIGYAIVAWPAEWDVTGRNTFIINNTGTVYQQDLGPQTASIVALMTEYNPPPGWSCSE